MATESIKCLKYSAGRLARTKRPSLMTKHGKPAFLCHAPGCSRSAGALLPYAGGDRRWITDPIFKDWIDLSRSSCCPRRCPMGDFAPYYLPDNKHENPAFAGFS